MSITYAHDNNLNTAKALGLTIPRTILLAGSASSVRVTVAAGIDQDDSGHRPVPLVRLGLAGEIRSWDQGRGAEGALGKRARRLLACVPRAYPDCGFDPVANRCSFTTTLLP